MSGKCSSQDVRKWSYDTNDTKAKIPWIWQGRLHRCQNAFKESFYKNQDSIVIWHWFVLLQYVSCFINDNGTDHTDSLWNFSRSHVARYQKEFVFATFLFFFVLFSVVKRAVCSYSHLILLYPICTIIKRNWKKTYQNSVRTRGHFKGIRRAHGFTIIGGSCNAPSAEKNWI